MNQTQHDHWNGAAGQAWVTLQEPLDGMFAPLTALLTQTAESRPEGCVLDIGCGTGATTVAMAETLDTEAAHTGVDISETMLALARRRAHSHHRNIDFIRADAQTHRFAPQAFDLIVSRFGVMFFADTAAAMTNIRSAARDDARLRFITWRSPAENPFMTTAERAAAPLMPALPDRDPRGPGQFALADRELLHDLLAHNGWNRVEVTATDVECALPLTVFEQYVTTMGPVGAFLRDAQDSVRHNVLDVLRAAFEPFRQDDEFRFTAACWVADAVAG